MFSKRNRHERTGSSGNAVAAAGPAAPVPRPANIQVSPAIPAPLVSPLQMTFDFELEPPGGSIADSFRPSEDSIARPRTSDGMGASSTGKSSIGLLPPSLPPIPRVASRDPSLRSAVSQDFKSTSSSSEGLRQRARDQSDNLPSLRNMEHPVNLMPTSGPLSGRANEGRRLNDVPEAESGSGTALMQASIFPARTDTAKLQSPVQPSITSGPVMSREFIDSRDKPYNYRPPSMLSTTPPQLTQQPPLPRPGQMPSSNSMPLLTNNLASFSSQRQAPPPISTLQTPPSIGGFYTQSLSSPQMPDSPGGNSLRAPKISGARLSPNSSMENLNTLQRTSTSGTAISRTTTNYSESTAARPTPSLHSSVTRPTISPSMSSPSPLSAGTIGTPYQENSPLNPLPQYVATRPKTAGATAKLKGVDVPTYHTSSAKSPNTDRATSKSDRRKTRLLNPMALLSRRKSSQTPEEIVVDRANAVQAYARQRSVAAVGVNKMPADFDPRIKSNRVHDFSAPKPPRRNFSHGDAYLDSDDQPRMGSHATPVPQFLYEPVLDNDSMIRHNHHISDGANVRRSTHSPVFREHLDDHTDVGQRNSSLNAERLENKDFLQRVSHHSSNSTYSVESAVLPPFARRSQVLDPMQANLVQDDDSKRSSDPSSGSGSGRGAGERNSNLSTISQVSPVTQRSSTVQQVVYTRDSPSYSLSPVSPAFSTDNKFRPLSGFEGIGPHMPVSPESRGRTVSEATARPLSTPLPGPATGDEKESAAAKIERERNPYRNSAEAPEWISPSSPGRRDTLSIPIPLPGRTSDMTTPEMTPEIGTANSISFAPVAATQPTATKSNASSAKVVEKRASAVGHSSKRNSMGGPKHRVSNASRFSFQFGESAGEEQALEEKGRLMGRASRASGKGYVNEDDEEDDFDEDAIDDMDELEMEQGLGEEGGEDDGIEEGHAYQQATAQPVKSPEPPHASLAQVKHTRQQLQTPDSDEESMYDEEENEIVDERKLRHLTWAEHPAMRGYSALSMHSHDESLATDEGMALLRLQQQLAQSPHAPEQTHKRLASGGSALTIDTSALTPNLNTNANSEFVQDSFSDRNSVPGGVAGARPRSGFYMQPAAAGYSPSTSATTSPQEQRQQESRPVLPHRQSGNSERNRVASGMSFGGPTAGSPRQITEETQQRITSASTLGGRSSGARSNSSGLGLSMMSDFNFSEGPDVSLGDTRPTSLGTADDTGPQSTVMTAAANRRTKDSETMPANAGWADLQNHFTPSHDRNSSGAYLSSPESNARSSTAAPYRGAIGKNIRQRNAMSNQNLQYAQSDSDEDDGQAEDDMYFDDGGFEQDIKTLQGSGARRPGSVKIDENQFDDDGYLDGYGRLGAQMPQNQRQRPMSGMPFAPASTAGDGPYPSFAKGGNPNKALARESLMLLEDLPLVNPVDPKLIPQRNPSEDAKRLGLSSRVPPLPAQPGSKEAVMRMQDKLQAYHASLAEAANKAAEEGRFYRQASVSTADSLAVGGDRGLGDDQKSLDERSHYSRDEQGAGSEGLGVPSAGEVVSRTTSQVTTGSKMGQSTTYSPPKLSFDFGFGEHLTNDNMLDDSLDDNNLDDSFGSADDDIIAAANAEALASDTEGFYGQEFGFYAKANPNNGNGPFREALNGGFFGTDGDDGLARNKSLQEPNLTPITERTEMSARNSFIHLGQGGTFGPASAGLASPALMGRFPVLPLAEGEVTDFEQLRKLKGNAFGGSNGSLRNDLAPIGAAGKPGLPPLSAIGGWNHAAQSPVVSARSPTAAAGQGPGYFSGMGGTPMSFGWSTDSNGSSSGPSSAHPGVLAANANAHAANNGGWGSSQAYGFQDSPMSANPPSSLHPAFGHGVGDDDVTPRKSTTQTQMMPEPLTPTTVRKVSGAALSKGHGRKGSDSVTYVREPDPAGNGQPRWVLERRRTSEMGKLELVGREVVQGGWI
ncbi:hypothetical protein LTR86_008205 [Recurvomyces mirabilis]|nr:hypothetical protein LTR86_008205 [Recurvomyces mirabilis]